MYVTSYVMMKLIVQYLLIRVATHIIKKITKKKHNIIYKSEYNFYEILS